MIRARPRHQRSINALDRIAIACTDKPPRLACDRGTIWQIVPHTQLQTDLDAGRAGQSPTRISPKTGGFSARTPEPPGGLRREDDGYEELEGLWQAGHVTA